ncbi:hypothetical protein MNBD_GAMMA12-149 [hydrothermal vent metagenome]|uniref:PPM-type phosphatase domain-containing protein n=1 Tax=hydrothermal vent metagenome TaxID=652676 RepID=A0A3B0Y3X5_9ZZZZ
MKIWYKIASHFNINFRPERNMVKQQSKACFTAGMASIVGGRESQQDNYQLISTSDVGEQSIFKPNCPTPRQSGSMIVAALTDGVGGQAAGDIAALLAAESFTESIQTKLCEQETTDCKTLMLDAVSDANLAIDIAINSDKSYTGMATTLVGVILNDQGLNWLSVGDSHLYLIRNEKIMKLNADHSMGALIDQDYSMGKITHAEAMNAPYRNVILSCLSGKKIELIDLYDSDWELSATDKLVLASDGLDSISHEQILTIVLQENDPQQCAQALINAVEDRKREYQDNTTVIVLHCG